MFYVIKVMNLFACYEIISNFAPSKRKKMIQNFIYILLCGIIILLEKFSGSECCA